MTSTPASPSRVRRAAEPWSRRREWRRGRLTSLRVEDCLSRYVLLPVLKVMRALAGVAIVPCIAAGPWLFACAESSMLPPATATPLPADKIERLAITCPPDHRTQSLDGGPVAVNFERPVGIGGQQPVTVGCSPETGSDFTVGSTDVACAATDALQQIASCAFSVTILPPPKLAVTRILAFGDSITQGVVSFPDGRVSLIRTSAYPFLLQQRLSSRYPAQDITVVNAGSGGEHVTFALGRFHAELRKHRPEVLLLMGGTNDVDSPFGSGPETAAAALERMVATARSANVDPYIMTIAPWRNAERVPLVSFLNDRIRSIAERQDVALVDVHRLLLTGRCEGVQPVPCIGADGVHPTEEGYRLIAEELERILVARYDVEIVPGPEDPQQGGWSPMGIWRTQMHGPGQRLLPFRHLLRRWRAPIASDCMS